jgi:hypothetical protein
MVVAQAVLEAAEETKNPVDYYAGITALCVVILFAKFTTHAARGKGPLKRKFKSDTKSWRERWEARKKEREAETPEKKRDREERDGWSSLHIFCVFLAWLAIAFSLFVLGWGDGSTSYESNMRSSVAFFAGVASIILALDVFNQR